MSGVRCVVALSDISPGDEITFDYCINGGGDTLWLCDCIHDECRLQIHSDFFNLPLDLQMEYLPLLDSRYIVENGEKVDRLRKSMSIS